MAPTDHPAGPARDSRPPGKGLDEATRQRLVALLYGELAESTRDALARGVPRERLDAQLKERVALLRARIRRLSAAETAAGDEGADNFGNAA